MALKPHRPSQHYRIEGFKERLEPFKDPLRGLRGSLNWKGLRGAFIGRV